MKKGYRKKLDEIENPTTLRKLARTLSLPVSKRMRGGAKGYLSNEELRKSIRSQLGQGYFPDTVQRFYNALDNAWEECFYIPVSCDMCLKKHEVSRYELGPFLCCHCKNPRLEEIMKGQQFFDF